MFRALSLLIVMTLLAACGSSETDQTLPTRISIEAIASQTAQGPTSLNARLQPTEIAFATTDVLEFWQAVRSEISAEKPDTWRFTGQEGDQIAVRVIGLDALLSLQDADGEQITGGERIEASLPETGEYTVRVFASGQGGEYQIGLSYTDRPNPLDNQPTRIPEQVGVPTPIPAYAELGSFIQRLEIGETIGGTLQTGDPSHIYTFDGLAGDYVQIEMQRVNGQIDPLLTLYDPDGAPLALDDDSGGEQKALLRNIVLPVDGLYTVQANGSSLAGGYSLRVLTYDAAAPVTPTQVAAPTATPIPTFSLPTPAPATVGNRLENHAPVFYELSSIYDVGIHPVYAAEGEVLTVGVSPAEGSLLRPEFEIVGPEGNVVAVAQSFTSDAGGDALVANYRAEVEGPYTVFVRGQDTTTGQYLISYGTGSTHRDILRGPAPFGEANQGDIARRGLRDVWTVELKAGDVITAAANPTSGSTLDPILEIAPANAPAEILVSDDNSGGSSSALVRDVRIPESGAYLVRVKAARAESFGPYALIWRYVNTAPPPTAPFAVFPLLVIDDSVPQGEYRFFPFYGKAGQQIRVQVTASEEGLDPVAVLVGPEGEQLISADDTDGTLNPAFTFELPTDGTYNLRVNGYLSGGAFQVLIEELF